MRSVAERRGTTTRSGALKELLRSAARLDRTQSDPMVAARNAIGVAAPLAMGALAGNAGLGLAATIGALQTAFADRPGPYRLRMLRMLGTALAAGVTSALAVVLSQSDVASALLLFVLGLGAGLLLSGGPSAAQVGVAATATALIIGHVRQDSSAAVYIGLVVFAGGAGQAVLAVAAWPLRRHRPERHALATLYRELGVAACQPPGTHVGPPASGSLTVVRQTLFGLGHDQGPSVEAYLVLVDEAEGIRRELIVLIAHAERLAAQGGASAARAIRAWLATSAGVLTEVAEALERGRQVEPGVLVSISEQRPDLVSVLKDPRIPGGELTRRAAIERVDNLAGQLRAAVDTAHAGASEGCRDEASGSAPTRTRLRDPLAILIANLTPDSAVLRHALRLGSLVAATDLVVRSFGVDRGYWIPLTMLVVLRPDFASTFQRSSMRVVGTIAGLLVATELIHWIPGGQWYQVALIGLFFFGMRFAGPGNLGLSAAALSALVVVLLSIAGVAPHATVVNRSVDTLIGGALALVAVLFSPVWERRLLPERLGELLAAYRTYLLVVLDHSAAPASLQQAPAGARLARSNALASLDRARAEPMRGQRAVDLGEAVLAHSHRFIHAMLTIDAVRGDLHGAGTLPELDDLMCRTADRLDRCAHAVRAGQAPGSLPQLRPAQERLARALSADPARAGGLETSVALDDACERLTNSLDTLSEELQRQLVAPPR